MNMQIYMEDKSYRISVGDVCIDNVCAVAVWRYPGEEWVVEKGDITQAGKSELSFALKYKFSCIEAEIFITVEENEIRFSGEMHHSGGNAVELARFHVFEGDIANDFLFRSYQSITGNTKVFSNNDELKPFVEHFEALWQSYMEFWLRLEEPYHCTSNWAVSGDIAHLFNKNNEFTIGFYAPGSAAGEIGYKTKTTGHSIVYGAVILDNILFEKGENRVLEKVAIIKATGNEGFDRWATLCSEMMAPRKAKPYLGHCSWYQKYSAIDEPTFLRAIDEFAEMTDVNIPVVVQIDDGFQYMPGVWDRPNSKFEKTFHDLPKMIAGKGEIPGLWIAPTTIWCNHPIVKEHPDAVQRCADGSYPIYFVNWGWCEPDDPNGTTYFLEPGHPITNEMIRKTVSDAVAAGWKYLKIDFTYCMSERRAAYDRKHTTFEFQRELYKIARASAGEDTIICACICGLFRHAIGYADTQRIGGDVVPSVESFKHSLADCITRASVGGKWWTADTDVFYMRQIDHLELEQKWIWTGTVGSLGSVFLTSDFPSQWEKEEMRRVRYFWRNNGIAPPQKISVLQDEKDIIVEVYIKNEFYERVLVYNWEDRENDVKVDLSNFGLVTAPKAAFPADISFKVENNILTCSKLKNFSMRIIEF